MMEIETRNRSDDGYGTDASFGSTECPTKSPIKYQKDDDRLNLRLIQKDSKDFRSKYFTEKVLNNSANGIIYQGKFLSNCWNNVNTSQSEYSDVQHFFKTL